MEIYRGIKAGTLWFFICIFFLISFANAENRTFPTVNENMAPFEAWRSALFCLQNHSDVCTKYVLGESGWLNVTQEDGHEFCTQGCVNHTRIVLTCINHVMRDYWFANKATLNDLFETIYIGCDTPQGFNGTTIISKGYKMNSASLISALLSSALLLVALL